MPRAVKLSPRLFAGLACALATVTACSLTYRAERSFERAIDMAGYAHVAISMPETDLIVRPREDENTARLSGTWYALGGTKKVAEKHANAANIDEVDYGQTLSLEAYWPSDAHGLVELELGRLMLPPGRDLSIVGEGGGIDVVGITDFVDVEVGFGRVLVAGTGEGADVYTGGGDVEVRTDRAQVLETPVRAVSLAGHVYVEQSTSGEVLAESANGDVEVRIPSDQDVDLYVYGANGVEVDTAQVRVSLASGEVRRTLQGGEISIWVIAHNGRAIVRSD